MPRSARPTAAARSPLDAGPGWPQRLTLAAFLLMLGLVLTRATMLEVLREAFEPAPGADPAPRGPGPAAGLGLDLLCCLPALMVLARRVSEKTYTLRGGRSFVPMAGLGAWMILSAAWAADRFAALVGGFHWLAAGALAWAAAQLVRSWLRLRLVAAVCFGLLLIYVAHATLYRLVDLPGTVRAWEQNKAKIMAEHGWEPGSHAAEQFDRKVHAGEMFGFTSSPNTLGAETSLLLAIAAGLLVQRLLDRDGREFAAPTLAIGLLLGVVLLGFTQSKAAFATLFLAASLVFLVWRMRARLARDARRAYWLGVAVVVAAIAAVVGHGLYHHTLPGASLAFRWHYWVGAARLFRLHPLLGIGWDNFGLYYLAVRLPVAPEEVKDPHDMLVRFACELGIVGITLAAAWLLRMWWELTRPSVPPGPLAISPRPSVMLARPGGLGALGTFATIAAIALLLTAWIGIDWATSPVDALLEFLRRLGYAGAFVVGATLVSLRSLDGQAAEARPAPWLLYAMLAGLGAFLVHNLVDFPIFEVGPMFLFALLAGSLLGARGEPPAGAKPKRRTAIAAVALAAGCAAWFGAAGFLWAPALEASRLADEADEAVRTAPPEPGPQQAAQLRKAVSLYTQANAKLWGLDAEQAYHAGAYAPGDEGKGSLRLAIEANPVKEDYYLARARRELMSAAPDRERVRSDYATALRLDPNNVRVRLEYADALARFGTPSDRAAAREAYAAALAFNDQLDPKENKRLKSQDVQRVREKIDALK